MRRIYPHRHLLSLVCLLLLAHGTHADDALQKADSVRTKDGKQHFGQVVFEDDERLVLRTNTRLRNFEQSELGEVHAVLRELPKALDKLTQLKPSNLDGHLDLAAAMADANLPHEARLLYWRVLTIDPTNAAAHKALEHRRVKDQWKVRAGSSWMKLPKAFAYHESWSHAWEFESSHFELRSNMPLRQALTAAFDLEYTYVQFHRLFGKPFELHSSAIKIKVWLHGDKKSYSDPNQGRGGYYQPRDRRLYVDGTHPEWRTSIVHESMHGIIDFAAAHTRKGKGNIPAWLQESLALYMEPKQSDGSYSDDPRAIGSSGVIRWLMRLHVNEKKPFSLKQVLNMTPADFALSSRTDLRYAQAYSLTYFCLNAEEGKHREAFFNFVRSAFQGKSSSTDFRKALGLREKKLEAQWKTYMEQF